MSMKQWGVSFAAFVAVFGACNAGAAVEIDFGSEAGRMKALHGVNNSPVRVVHPNGWSSAPQGQWEFAAAGIPYVRLHDTAGQFGGTHYVDVPNIFPDFAADENDPKSYDFVFTDAYLKPLVAAGCTPFYRLGVTIESNSGLRAYNTYPPKDPAKWARICEHIIRHYNEGWANGFKWNLKYWEIWNEPEGHSCWRGTQAEFFELYRVSVSYLKAKFPQLKFGGYGSIGFYAVDQPDNKLWGVNGKHNTTKWAEEFISHMAEKKVPIDFFSWHIYVRNGYGPDRIGVHARYARQLLDKYGYTEAENILDEWNVIEDVNMTGYKDKDWDGLKEMKSGAPVAAAFAVMQNAPLDLAMYYDALPTRKYCGLFYYPSERTTPCYETFLAFNELYKLGGAVKARSDEKDIYVLAATDGKVQKFYLVNISASEAKTIVPAVSGAKGVFSVRLLDGVHPKLTANGVWKPGESVTLPPTSLLLIGNEAPPRGVPAGCDPAVMSEAYWKIWNDGEQAKIDADIEANRKADAEVELPIAAGTEVSVEQLDHDFRFGAHIFNFNQLGKTEYNDAYKASYGKGGIFNQATVAFYWNKYEPVPGKLRAFGDYEDTERFWNSLSQEEAMLEPYWRRPAPGPVIDFLKSKDVAIHGHILVWGMAKPYWIYDWYCPEEEKRAFDALGIPRHSAYIEGMRGVMASHHHSDYAQRWVKTWEEVFKTHSEDEIAKLAPVFTANMRKIFRKRVFDVAKDFGDVLDSWDVVNESSKDWANYRASRSGKAVWRSRYGLMPGDYPLDALLDAKEAIAPAAKLVINDYNICDDFLTQVKDLEKEGAKIDIVGCQMHIFNTNDCMRLAQGETKINWVGTPKVIQDRLDMMAKTGKPLHVSEITITSPGSDDRSRQIQAILTRNIYRKWFSHQALMGITWWNTVDGGGVYGEPLVSGLFTRDLKKKPAYLALDELINHEWKTSLKVKAEASKEGSVVKFRGFRGKYRLTWKDADGNSAEKCVHVK